MEKQSGKDNISGTIRIEENAICWSIENKDIARVQIDDIVIIGEYTNSDGPYFDDWFWVFVTKDSQWQSIPWYSANIDELTTLLCEKFQSDLDRSLLLRSTVWASVVRYPAHLKNKTLFTLIPTPEYKEPKTFFDKILYGTGFGDFNTDKYIELTDEVKMELQAHNS